VDTPGRGGGLLLLRGNFVIIEHDVDDDEREGLP
jgi:hypothetical protein